MLYDTATKETAIKEMEMARWNDLLVISSTNCKLVSHDR